MQVVSFTFEVHFFFLQSFILSHMLIFVWYWRSFVWLFWYNSGFSLCQNRKQKLRERKRESWQRDCKADGESKSLSSEKETEDMTNSKRPIVYSIAQIICLQVTSFTFEMTFFLLQWVLFSLKFLFLFDIEEVLFDYFDTNLIPYLTIWFWFRWLRCHSS